MMMDYITIAGYTLAVFGAGVAVGKLVEKIERLDRKNVELFRMGCQSERIG